MVTPTPTPPPQIRKKEEEEKDEIAAAVMERLEGMRKDVSLISKAIRQERKRKLVEMKMQVMDTLTEATFLKMGGPYKAILEMNRGLIHVLELIDQAPNGKISTRELLRTLNSTSMHKLLKEAEAFGFVKRELVKMPEGQKGGKMMANSLTEEGRVLLGLAGEYSSAKEGRR